MNKPRFRIAIVNGAMRPPQDFSDPTRWVQDVSTRESRAKKLAARLRREGNQNVQLFKVGNDSSMMPISLETDRPRSRFVGHSGMVQIGQPIEPKARIASSVRRVLVSDDDLAGFRALLLVNALRTL